MALVLAALLNAAPVYAEDKTVDIGNGGTATYTEQGDTIIGKGNQLADDKSGRNNVVTGTDNSAKHEDGEGKPQQFAGDNQTLITETQNDDGSSTITTNPVDGTKTKGLDGAVVSGNGAVAQADGDTSVGKGANITNPLVPYYADENGKATADPSQADYFTDPSGNLVHAKDLVYTNGETDPDTGKPVETTDPYYKHTYETTVTIVHPDGTVEERPATTSTAIDQNAGKSKTSYTTVKDDDGNVITTKTKEVSDPVRNLADGYSYYSKDMYNPSTDSLAAGTDAKVTGADGVAAGHDASAAGNSVAVGHGASSDVGGAAVGPGASAGVDSVATGINSQAADNGVASGASASAGEYGTAVGDHAYASDNSQAIGASSQATADSTAVGNGSRADWNSIAVGNGSTATGNGSAALGNNTSATVEGGVALGEGSVANTPKENYGWDPVTQTQASATDKGTDPVWFSNRGAVSVGKSDADGNPIETRQITNVAAGTKDSDAVNVAQLKSAVETTKTHYYGWNDKDDHQYNYDNEGATGNRALAAGVGAAAAGDGATSVGNYTNASGKTSIAIGGTALDADGNMKYEQVPKMVQKVDDNGQPVTDDKGNPVMVQATDDEGNLLTENKLDANGNPIPLNTEATGENAIAVGTHAKGWGQDSIAIGTDSKASATDATAVGRKSNAWAPSASAFGAEAEAGKNATAVGKTSHAYSENATSVGADSNANYSATAVGQHANATSGYDTAVGQNSTASGSYSVAVGNSAMSSYTQSTAVGDNAHAVNSQATALGYSSMATGSYSTAVGQSANANSTYDTAVGNTAHAYGSYSTAVGYSANSQSNNTTAVGYSATASSSASTAVGQGSSASGSNATAVGDHATTHNSSATAVGQGSSASATYSTAVGNQASTGYSANNSTAVGRGSSAGGSYSTAVGDTSSANSQYSTTVGYYNSANQYGTSVGQRAYSYDYGTSVGENASAGAYNSVAVGSQAKASGSSKTVAIGYSASAGASNAVAIGGGMGGSSSGSSSMDYSSNTSASAPNTVAIGSNAKASSTNAIAIGSNQSTGYYPSASSQNSIAIGSNAKASNSGAIAIGSNDGDTISSTGTNSIAIGSVSKATNTNAIGIGTNANAYAENAVRIGASTSTGNNAVSTNAVGIGTNVNAYGSQSVRIGYSQGTSNNAAADNAVGIGTNTNAWGTNSVRIGYSEESSSNGSGINSVSIGYNTKAGSTGNNNATAVGMNTNASGQNSTGVGFSNTASNYNTTAVGFQNSSSGSGATAVGFANGASGDYSSALGFVNKATVTYGTAVGFDSHAEGENEGNNGAYKRAVDVTDASGSTSTKYIAVDQDSHALLTDATGNVVRTTSGSVVMQNQDGTAYYARDAEGNYYAVTKYGVNTYSQGDKLDEAPTDLDVITDGDMVKVNDNLALGNHNHAQNTNASAMGYSNTASGIQSSAVGFGNQASGVRSSAFGYASKALGENSFASGFASQAVIDDSVALGGLAYADRVAATSVVAEDGTGVDGNQYIGYDVTGTSHAGDLTGVWRSTKAAVSIGDVNNKAGYGIITRQITDVAAGSADTDAVNVAQLKALQSKFEDTDTRNKIHDYSVLSPGIDNDTNYNNEGAVAMNAMAAGVNASATGLSSIAIGEATANGDQSIAIGKGAVSTGYKAVVIGANTAVGQSNMAFGEGNHAGVEADKNGAYSLLYNGTDANGKLTKLHAVTDLGMHEAYLDADGKTASATETIGKVTKSYLILKTQDGTKAVLKDGNLYNVTADNKVGEIMVGKDFNYLVTHSTASDGAVFESADSKQGGKYATAFGLNNVASGDASLAFGGNAIRVGGPTGNKATAVNAVAFGNSTEASGQDTVAFGDRAKATNDEAVAFGQNTLASAGRATAFGESTKATGQVSTAFGDRTTASGIGATAFGNKSVASGHYATAWGGGDREVKDNQGNVISRTGPIASGLYSTAFGSGTQAVANNATAWGQESVAGSMNDDGTFTVTQNDGSKQKAVIVGGYGYKVYSDANNNNGETPYTVNVDGKDYTVLTANVGTSDNPQYQAVYLDDNRVAHYVDVADGKAAVPATDTTTRLRNMVIVDGVYSGSNATAFGYKSQALGTNSMAAIGGIVNADTENSAAIGSGAKATLSDAIALGSGAVAKTEAGQVGYDLLNEDHSADTTGVWKSTKNAIAVGDAENKITRQITGVAAGTNDTDAVNVAQLKRMSDVANSKHTLVTVNPTKTEAPKDTTTGKYTDAYDTENGNLNIRAKTEDGQTSFNIKMNDQIGLGQKGEPGQDGKDGVDGKVTVTEKDGTTIIIGKDGEDGAPGLTIKGPKGDDGTDGKDAVAINGKDGIGTIGLNGKDGKDGIDGTSTSITTIRTEYVHEPGVDGKNGADGQPGETRIIYKDPDGNDHTVSTLDDGMKYGANIADATDWSNPVYNKLNSTVYVKGGAESSTKYQELVAGKTTAEDKYNAVKEQYSGENILTTVSKDTNGDTTINVLLDKDLHENTVTAGEKGDPGTPGKDGVDGKVTVVEKDGSTVVIGKDGKDGKNGISIKGADGKDGVSITGPTGEPGKDGNDGHIGIAGKDGKDAVAINGTDGVGTIGLAGKDGKDGISTTTIRTEYVTKPGVNGEDGKDGITRIIYKDPDGNDHDVATLDDGLKFTGNNSSTINHNKLDTTVHVVGEGTDSDLTKFKSAGGNIAVEANGKDDNDSTLTIKLNKDVNLGNDGSLTVGGDTNNTNPIVIKHYNDGDLVDNHNNTVTGGDYITGLDNRTWDIDNPTYVSGRAATEDELKQAGDQINTKITNITDATKGGGFGLQDEKTGKVSQDLGTNIQIIGDGTRTYKDDGKGGKVIDKVEDSNITTKVVKLEDGTKAVKVALSDDVNIGGNDGKDGHIGVNGKDGRPGADGKDAVSINAIGKDGEDGADGQIGVNGKDGTTIIIGKDAVPGEDGKDGLNGISIKGDDGKDGLSGVTIVGPQGSNGRDGYDGIDGKIGISGKDGKDAVSISGKDGIGQIGLTGKDGADGKTITTTISTLGPNGTNGKDGIPGVDGKKGDPGITRIQYNDGTTTQTVATLNDGMKFTGNNSDTVNHNKLNTTVNVVGEGTGSDLTNFKSAGGNIAVEANGGSDDASTLTIKLNKDVNLGGDGSLTVGGDTKNGDAIVIKNHQDGDLTDNKGNKVEGGDYITGLDNRTWNVDDPTYVSGRAATEDELKQAGDQINTKITNVENKITNISDADKGGGFGLQDEHTGKVSQDLGTNIQIIGDGTRTYKDDGNGGKVIDTVTDSNITTEVVTLEDSSKAVEVALSDNVNLGGKGKDGKDGVDGHIGINGKDGKSGVGIDGKDGISMQGEAGKNGISIKGDPGDDGQPGKDGISIKGPSGENGDNGHIGISGKDGKDAVALDGKDGVGHIGLTGPAGKDGKNASADISVKNGSNGVDGTDGNNGKDGMDRITYVDHNEVTHEVATLDDGLNFTGNNTDTTNHHKLNTLVKVQGEGTGTDLSNFKSAAGNIAVEADGKDTLTIKLNKDLTNLNSVTTNNAYIGGNTVINNTGITTNKIVVGNTTVTNNSITVNNGTNIDMGGNQIHNVKAGTAPTDAVNVSQLGESNTTMSNRINRLGDQIDRVGAHASAMAALHPLDFDPDEKLDFAAGFGNYKGEHAAAIGAFYRPNEDTMFSLGGSVGGGDNMVNVGVSFKLGQHNHVSVSRVALAKEVLELRKELENVKSYLADQAAGNTLDLSKIQLFPDTPENHWAYDYVATMAGNGVLEGYPDGYFKGNRNMTRYEMAAVLYRMMQNGAKLSARALTEFAPELDRIRVDTITKDGRGVPHIQRVRTVKGRE